VPRRRRLWPDGAPAWKVSATCALNCPTPGQWSRGMPVSDCDSSRFTVRSGPPRAWRSQPRWVSGKLPPGQSVWPTRPPEIAKVGGSTCRRPSTQTVTHGVLNWMNSIRKSPVVVKRLTLVSRTRPSLIVRQGTRIAQQNLSDIGLFTSWASYGRGGQWRVCCAFV